ncbi:glycosyltransferase [Lewinella sp. W8]|uniref:glycosyltransferase n=1 Tax=Lewinella sp. W8 TaxID=2528208 RepID=UPI0010686DFE|nr:glycosyltransferase [Lewinella sp. W8]MTB53188.1 glycosyltransferase [Lewinella sp. W8]
MPFPVHILLPTHQRYELLTRCLDSLLQVREELAELTIHVIENGSEGAGALVQTYADRLPVTYRQIAEGNKSKALNAVVEELPDAAFLIFFDDDIKVEPGTIRRHREAAERYGPGHYFGGALRADYEIPPPRELLPYFPPSCRDFDLSEGKAYREFDGFRGFLGPNWSCFRSDLHRVGNFSPLYGPGAVGGARGQEWEAQSRLAAAGVTPVFVGGSWARHWVPRRAISRQWVVDRIYHGSILRGKENPSLAHSLVMLAKLAYSALLFPLQLDSVGHPYRINKAVGYFRGMVDRYLAP